MEPRGWDIKKASFEAHRVIMVIGAADTGKTSFVEALADVLSKDGPTAIVDLDMGQSHIGPPTTIGWGKVSGGFGGWGTLEAEGIYFTGALSPPGNLLPGVVGASLMLEDALKWCDRAIIDTTGLVTEPVGRIYKQYKADILCPDLLVAIEREQDDLSHILGPFHKRETPSIMRVRAPEAARAKTADRRADHRAEMFSAYFKNAGTVEVGLDKTGVRFTREVDKTGLLGRVVSFRKNSKDLAIGVIESVDSRGERLSVRTPLKAGEDYTTLVIGSYTLVL